MLVVTMNTDNISTVSSSSLSSFSSSSYFYFYSVFQEYKDYSCCCGWITREHLEAFIYWAITCWSRKKNGRGGIKYSNYQPLRGDNLPNDTDHSGVIDTSIAGDSTHSNKSTGSTKSLSEKREEFQVELEDDHTVSVHAEKDYERGQWLNKMYGKA